MIQPLSLRVKRSIKDWLTRKKVANMVDFQVLRQAMIEGQICSGGVTDPLLLKAFSEILREDFVPDVLRNQA